jgi:hypothetical protein
MNFQKKSLRQNENAGMLVSLHPPAFISNKSIRIVNAAGDAEAISASPAIVVVSVAERLGVITISPA